MPNPIPLVDAPHNTHNVTQPSRRAWIIVLTASLFFFYEFIQMNMMDAISGALLQAFDINADELGDLSSYYFLANVIFLFIAGSLLDRYSTRRVILISLGGIGLIQRLYGYILQTHAQQRVDYTATTYLTSDFHFAMIIFFVGYVVALLASLLVKETYCVQRGSS